MKWIYFGLLVLLLTLSGCSNHFSSQQSKEKMFYSKHKDQFIIVTIGDKLEFDQLESTRVDVQKKVESVFNIKSVNAASRNYKFLNVKKSPEYFIFNSKKMVYKTNSLKDVVSFLKSH